MIILADKINCSHILVNKQSEALSVIERLKKGESFDQLAKEVSIDRGSGKRGGDLGFFGRGTMVRAFEVASFKLEKNQISEPVKSEFGYHIIKRTA
ncbi:MAG TPA: peptidylprolyl isomerase [Nitrososphaeraceae archaeon]|nr:peptidylprolyl isomerase [Nitrososphaeraceae archaeon]